MVLSLVARLIFVTFFMDNNTAYWEDTIHYYGAAKSLISNGHFGIDPERPALQLRYGLEPVYPLFLAPLLLIFRNGFLGIRIVQSIVIAVSSLLFYKINRVFVDRKFALLGSALYLFYPFYIYFSGVILPEAIYVPVLVLYTYLVLMYIKRRKTKYLYLSIALLAFLGHLKVTSWSLGLVSAVAFLTINHRLNKQFFIRAIACALIFLAICLPWGMRNYAIHGRIGLPRNYASTDGRSELTRGFSKRSSLKKNAIMLFSPNLTKVDSQNKFNRPFYKHISMAVVAPLLIATLILPVFDRRRIVLFLYLILFSYCLPYLLLYGQTRYRLPIDFVMIMFLVILISLCPWCARKDEQSFSDFEL
jgi:4-amino-4-deoxy-L-arabinose transferase-like glycosyltransferase